MDDEDTQAIADARETRDLVLSAVLRLAGRVLAHMEAHEALAVAAIDESYPAGGFTWELRAMFRRGNSFVRVVGNPQPTQQGAVSIAEMAQIMGNQSAGFETDVPREWIEMALKQVEDAHAGTFA